MPEHRALSWRRARRPSRDVLGQMPVEIPLGERRVVAASASPAPGPDRAPPPRWPGGSFPRVRRSPQSALRIRTGPMCSCACVAVGSTRDVQPVLEEIPVLVVAPEFAPGLAVGHHGAPAGAAHLGIEVPRLLRREPFALQPPRGDQQMRVPVRPLGLALALMRRVHVELHREALGDEVLLGERSRQVDPVLAW